MVELEITIIQKKDRGMKTYEKREYINNIPHGIECFLGADIGGTNSNFGVFRKTDGKLQLILSLHFKSQLVTNFTDLVKTVLHILKKDHTISIKHSCFAGAGVVSPQRDRCKPTNLHFVIDAHEIIENTEIECATIANDFEIIGYGLHLINEKNLVQVNKEMEKARATKCILGAGTGLGKSILTWNKTLNRYLPHPSEGGHADFSPQSKLEFDFLEFIRTTENRKYNISWEDVLSGNGIGRMYHFFHSRNGNEPTNKKLGFNGPHPDEIFKNRDADTHSRHTFELYKTLYARCAKNWALDTLALGGVYIAGGIAAKNLNLFEQKSFMKEFVNSEKQMEILKSIPIYVITDYNISLYGAAEFMLLEKTCTH